MRWNRRSDACRSGRRTSALAGLRRGLGGHLPERRPRDGGLLRCDGGEEVDRFTSDDPRLLAFIGDRMEQRGVTMEVGKLTFVPASEAPELVAEPVRPHLQDGLWVTEIDPDLADTAAFCEHYDIGLDVSANCVVVEARRAERTWHAACVRARNHTRRRQRHRPQTPWCPQDFVRTNGYRRFPHRDGVRRHHSQSVCPRTGRY